MANFHLYGGDLKGHPRTIRTIEQAKPGLTQALTNILTSLGREEPTPEKTLRVQHIVIPGQVYKNPMTHSEVVREFAAFFRDHMWEELREFLREKILMGSSLAGYKGSRHRYMCIIHEMAREHELTKANFMQVMIVDSLQGCQAETTIRIGDASNQNVDGKSDIGFMEDYSRFNVIATSCQVRGGSLILGRRLRR